MSLISLYATLRLAKILKVVITHLWPMIKELILRDRTFQLYIKENITTIILIGVIIYQSFFIIHLKHTRPIPSADIDVVLKQPILEVTGVCTTNEEVNKLPPVPTKPDNKVVKQPVIRTENNVRHEIRSILKEKFEDN